MMDMRYSVFLEKLNIIHEKWELKNGKHEDFNIFSILRNERDEVNLHSKFIGELLKNKNHGILFLEKLLKMMEVYYDEKIESFEIITEHSTLKNGRIDIVIKLFLKNKKKVIVIENKIDAEDQWRQLERYNEAMRDLNYSEDEIEIVYLTLYGDEPSKESRGELNAEKIKIISYRENLIEWVTECIKEVSLIPGLRETLLQYRELLQKITKKENMGAIMEMKNLVLSSEEYIKVAYMMPDILKAIKIELQLKFWNILENEMKRLEDKFNLKKETDFKFPNLNYSEKTIKKYYTNSNNRKYYGLMYEIKEIESIGRLYLRVEVDHRLYWGIRFIDKSGEYNKNNKNNEVTILDVVSKMLNFESSSHWMGWKYLYRDDMQKETLNFNEFDEMLVFSLNTDFKIEDLVKKIVQDIERDYEIIKRSLDLI